MTRVPRMPACATLGAFARAYLHQDAFEEYGSARAAAEAWLTDASPDERRRARREAEACLTVAASWNVGDWRTFLAERLGATWWPASRREAESVFRLLGRPSPTPSSRRP